MSREMLRLLRSKFNETPDRPRSGPGPMTRLMSPSRLSTVITSAPRSPRIWVASGPITTEDRSSTRTPSSGPPGAPSRDAGMHVRMPEKGGGTGSPVVMTTFVFTDEQQDLRAMVRRFLAEKSPVSDVRRLMATEAGYDPAVWAQLGHLGLAGLTIPEKYGGAGCGPVEQLIVCEEMGAALLCAPYLASAVLATWALLASEDPMARTDLLPPIASGEIIATLAVPEDDGSWAPAEFSVTARRSGENYLVDGRKSFVLDGMIADLILVAASSDDGPALFAVDGDAPGLSRQAMQTIDLTRKPAVLTFNRTPGRLVGQPGAAAEIVAQAVRGGVREGPAPVRPGDRQFPGDQAPLRGHAARGRVRQVRRLPRHLGGGRRRP